MQLRTYLQEKGWYEMLNGQVTQDLLPFKKSDMPKHDILSKQTIKALGE